MTPQAVALLVRADPSLKHVAAALQGLEEGGEEWRREFQEAGGWGALERLLLARGDAGVPGSGSLVSTALRCMQVALTEDALSPSLDPPDRASLVRAVATCVRADDEGVRGLALEVLAAVAAADASDAHCGGKGGEDVVSALEAGAPGAAEGGRRGRGYAGFAVELVEALRNEPAWSLKVFFFALPCSPVRLFVLLALTHPVSPLLARHTCVASARTPPHALVYSRFRVSVSACMFTSRAHAAYQSKCVGLV